MQNATLAQHVSHRAWQGYIAHATAWSADKPTTQKMLASTLQVTA